MREWSNNRKGAVAELAIRLAAERAGIGVYLPSTEHSRADMLFEIGSGLWRVQCKWGRLCQGGDVVSINLTTSRCTPTGYVRTKYSAREVDLFAVYCGELDRCFLLPIEMCAERRAVQLRLLPARNNQRACINLAEDFAFDGAIAQLEERLRGTQEVAGSSPASSTPPDPAEVTPTTIGSNPFRNHFGYWLERVARGEEVIVTFRGKPRMRLVPIAPPLLRAA